MPLTHRRLVFHHAFLIGFDKEGIVTDIQFGKTVGKRLEEMEIGIIFQVQLCDLIHGAV